MKGRKHREAGGVNEAKEDLDDKPEERTNAKKIDDEAKERNAGGRAGRKHGGKMVGKVEGKEEKHAGRSARKSGGRTGSDGSPFSSARNGKQPGGHKVMSGEPGLGED